jgi:succinoglycan biosynthesis protein ExoA
MSPVSATANPVSTARPLADSLPFISVILPVRNEGRYLRGILRQLLNQQYDRERFEILVADGRSTDTTADIVRELAPEHPNLHLLDNPSQWSSAGRNVALRAAQGELLVVIDGHCDLNNPFYLRKTADAFQRSGADCLGRPQPLDVSGATVVQKAIALARSSWLGHHPASFIYSMEERFVPPESVAVTYRREVFEAVGLFDETFDACEDVELNHRVALAGFRCFFTPQVGLPYYPRSSLAGLFRQMLRYGRGRVRMMHKHPDTFSVLGFLPAVWVVGLIVGAAVSWLSVVAAIAYVAGMTLYGLVVAGVSAALSARARDIRMLAWLPAVFITVHLGAGMGLLCEMLLGSRRAVGTAPRRLQRVSREVPQSGDNRVAA